MSGLMQSFTQQADFEAAQLSIVVNPLVKIFTGEIPYRSQNDGASEEDAFSLSLDSRKLFEIYWNMLMANSNTVVRRSLRHQYKTLRATISVFVLIISRLINNNSYNGCCNLLKITATVIIS